jgi:predicted ATPase
VERLLSTCPNLRVLATSREPLALRGELVYHVPPLPVSQAGDDVAEVGASDAVRLFQERAVAVRRGPVWSPAALAAIASICRELDGLPLALELAAARTNVLTVEEIATRLDDRFRFLRYWRRSPEPRHQTLGTMMAWSYDLLSEDERALLRRLSIFAHGFTLGAAADVCLQGDAEAALALITRLVDGSLVIADPLNGSTRYRMLETVRRYGAERLEDAGDTEQMHRKHAAYFLDLAERQWEDVDAPSGGSWWTALEEGDNLRAAVSWYIERGLADASLRFVCWLTWFWERTDRIAEGRMWCERALALEGEVEGKSRGQALYAAGSLSWLANDFAQASRFLARSLRLLKQTGDELWLARVLDRLGDLYFVMGRLETSRLAFEESLQHFTNLAREGGVAAAKHGLGQVYRDLGDMEAARLLLASAAAIHRGRGDRATLAATLHSMGDLELEDRELTAAAERYAESLALARSAGMGQRTIAYCLAGLAAVAAARGDAEGAGHLWGAVEQLEERMGVKLHAAERARYERLMARVEGRPAFDGAVSAGRRLSLEQAVARARSLG